METRHPNVEHGSIAEVPAQPRHSAGNQMLPGCQVIELHVAESNQLFNAIGADDHSRASGARRDLAKRDAQ